MLWPRSFIAEVIPCLPNHSMTSTDADHSQYAGCHVIATARNLDAIKDLGAKGLTILPLDVTSKESIAECKTQVEQLTSGRLDILVNNA